jgi:hypothetical protein
MESRHSPRGKFAARVMSRASGSILALAVFIAAAETNPSQLPLTPAEKAAIERVAAHASTGPDKVGQMLNSIGYNPDIPGFKAFPVVRKIESAYLSAEQGRRDQASWSSPSSRSKSGKNMSRLAKIRRSSFMQRFPQIQLN